MSKSRNTTRAAAIPRGWALGLKFTRANGETDGRDGRPVFVWPLTPGAMVTAPDWRPDATCGGGLHFWPDGVGDVSSCDYHSTAAHGMVVAYPPAESVALDGKAKAARVKIIYVGTLRAAAAWLSALRPGIPVVYGTATAGYGGTATAGDSGTATAGDRGTATAGGGGALVLLWWDGTRYRRRCAEVDGVNIKANTPYRLNADGEFVEVVK